MECAICGKTLPAGSSECPSCCPNMSNDAVSENVNAREKRNTSLVKSVACGLCLVFGLAIVGASLVSYLTMPEPVSTLPEPVSTLRIVAIGLPLIGMFALAALAVWTLDSWYPFVLAIIFSPLLLCVAIPGMILALRLPAADGIAHTLKTLALALNGLILAPFAAILAGGVVSFFMMLIKFVVALGYEVVKYLSNHE